MRQSPISTSYNCFFALPLSTFSALLSAVKALLHAPTLLQIKMRGMMIQNAFMKTK